MPMAPDQEIRVLTATLTPGDVTERHSHRHPVTGFMPEAAFTPAIDGRDAVDVAEGQALVAPSEVAMTGRNGATSRRGWRSSASASPESRLPTRCPRTPGAPPDLPRRGPIGGRSHARRRPGECARRAAETGNGLTLFRNFREDGAPEEIRTPDPQIRSLVLYPAELRVRRAGI